MHPCPQNHEFCGGIHSVVEECEIMELLEKIDPRTKNPMKKKIIFVKTGAVVLCHIQVNDTICVEKFSGFLQLGRFTLRDEGKIVAQISGLRIRTSLIIQN